jgi:NTP pyrophosphatase (non-canonical NTP hydrolase)
MMELAELQEKTDQWIREYGVRYFDEMTNLALLMEEVGELARHMARTYGEQSGKPGESHAGIAEEIGDILFVLTCLSNQTGVDMNRAMEENFIKKTSRDQTRHKENPKLKK